MKSNSMQNSMFSYIAPSSRIAHPAGVDAVAELADPPGAELDGVARGEERGVHLVPAADVELEDLVGRLEPEAVVREPPAEPAVHLDPLGVLRVVGGERDQVAAAEGRPPRRHVLDGVAARAPALRSAGPPAAGDIRSPPPAAAPVVGWVRIVFPCGAGDCSPGRSGLASRWPTTACNR